MIADISTEPCKRCRAKGVRFFGQPPVPVTCGTCKGAGVRTYAQSAEKRAHIRDLAKARKAKKLAEAIAAFQQDYPRVWAWLVAGRMEFARNLHAAVLRWGGLTHKQLEAAIRCERRGT